MPRRTVPNSSALGRFPMPSPRENWLRGGTNRVNSFSLPQIETDLVGGYDATIQARVIELLGSDYEFRAQCQTLLNGNEIDIKIRDIDYASFVVLLSSFQILADSAKGPKHVKRTIVDLDVLRRIFDNGKNLVPMPVNIHADWSTVWYLSGCEHLCSHSECWNSIRVSWVDPGGFSESYALNFLKPVLANLTSWSTATSQNSQSPLGIFFFQWGSTTHFWGPRVSISRICLRLLLECCSRPKGQTEVDHQDEGRRWAGPSGYCVL